MDDLKNANGFVFLLPHQHYFLQ